MSMTISVSERVAHELQGLSEAKLQQVADFAAFLKRQERINELAELEAIDDETLAKLYADAATEDRELAEEGLTDYVRGLEKEDRLWTSSVEKPDYCTHLASSSLRNLSG